MTVIGGLPNSGEAYPFIATSGAERQRENVKERGREREREGGAEGVAPRTSILIRTLLLPHHALLFCIFFFCCCCCCYWCAFVFCFFCFFFLEGTGVSIFAFRYCIVDIDIRGALEGACFVRVCVRETRLAGVVLGTIVSLVSDCVCVAVCSFTSCERICRLFPPREV